MELSIQKKSDYLTDNKVIQELYGVDYFDSGEHAIAESNLDDLYYFKTYIGSHTITVEKGDSLFYLSEDETTAHIECGATEVISSRIATIIRGYMPENKSSTIRKKTNLPYVNACSTKQVFPPERLGDPTLQLLHIPPHSAEQAHHIHSTVRVVYILSGSGRSIVGMGNNCIIENLYQGKVIILQKMCPHHFETDDEPLVALPLHIFSSVGSMETKHPMYDGTHLTR